MTVEILEEWIFDDFDAHGVDNAAVTMAPDFYYHITNQTGVGGSVEFPVVTEVTLKDLRIVQWYADGSCRQAALFDGDGIPTSTLEPSAVFLESFENATSHALPLEAVCVAGKIDPSVIEIQTAPGDPVRVVRIRSEFLIDIVDPQSGAYFAITARDREGNRYPIGTFGLLSAESEG